MPANIRKQRVLAKSMVALLLTFGAGIVDIAGFVIVYRLFTANLTGDTVHLGNKLALHDWAEVEKAACIIASFVLGAVIARVVIEAGARKEIRAIASVTLLLEATLLVAFIKLNLSVGAPAGLRNASVPVTCGLLALLATAMGVQSATLTRIGPMTVHTTFVTGMLNKFGQAASSWLFWMHDERRMGVSLANVLRRSGQCRPFREARFTLAIWLFYTTGAVSGTLLISRWHVRTFYLPVLFVLIAIAVDQSRPLSIEEERDEV